MVGTSVFVVAASPLHSASNVKFYVIAKLPRPRCSSDTGDGPVIPHTQEPSASYTTDVINQCCKTLKNTEIRVFQEYSSIRHGQREEILRETH